MTLIEAMKWAKEDPDRSFARPGSPWFVSYRNSFVYKFTAEEILAEDWEDAVTYIPKLTQGRWGAAPPDK